MLFSFMNHCLLEFATKSFEHFKTNTCDEGGNTAIIGNVEDE